MDDSELHLCCRRLYASRLFLDKQFARNACVKRRKPDYTGTACDHTLHIAGFARRRNRYNLRRIEQCIAIVNVIMAESECTLTVWQTVYEKCASLVGSLGLLFTGIINVFDCSPVEADPCGAIYHATGKCPLGVVIAFGIGNGTARDKSHGGNQQ